MTIEASHLWPASIVMIFFWYYLRGLSNRIMRKIFSHWRLEPVYFPSPTRSSVPFLPFSGWQHKMAHQSRTQTNKTWILIWGSVSSQINLLMLNKLRYQAHFLFSANQLLDPGYWYKFKYWMTNSTDPDQKPTDLDLHCLQRQGISGFSSTSVIFISP